MIKINFGYERIYRRKHILLLFFLLFSCTRPDKPAAELQAVENLEQKAIRLSREFIIVDGHVDLPYRLEHREEDISTRTQYGHFDFQRAVEGGLDAPFMSIYVPASIQTEGSAKKYADHLINGVEELTRQWPDKFQIVRNPEQIRINSGKGIISFPLGIENGAAIEGDIKNLRHFYERGIRYITLTHSKWNLICDSSYDKERKWNGLSPFGEKVVKEMNRLGIMVDVSHVSDSAFYQVLAISAAPVIASHSSCRYFTPGFERNMSDDMIKKMADMGGVILINFGSDFINGEFQKKMDPAYNEAEKQGMKWGSYEMTEYMKKYKADNHVPVVTVEEVADHIEHVKTIAGIQHVGFGSDYDGISEVPQKLEDVSMYPNLVYCLLKRGYSDEEIRLVCSGNVFRVWDEVERVAAVHQNGQNP